MPLHVSTPTPPLSPREAEILRALGRLGPTLGMSLQDLVVPDLHDVTRRRLLTHLVERKLIWRASIPHPQRDEHGRSRGRAPHVFGLTDDGKELLSSTDQLANDDFEHLLSRSKQAPSPPSLASLQEDAYVADWCSALLDQIRRTPLLAGVQLQRRYRLEDDDGELQTIGVLLVIMFDPAARSFRRVGWEIPWMSLTEAIPTGWRAVCLALEVDNGLMALPAVFALARRYAELERAGVYRRMAGGAVKPVMLTAPGQRCHQVVNVWQQAWPGNPALVSTFARTAHPTYGPLWGDYLAVKSNSPATVRLLGNLLGTVDEWPTRIRQWSPSLVPASAPTDMSGTGV